MELILTNETDERFINYCKEFGCEIKEPQVVLLLTNFNKIIGCSSFKEYDENSCEITTLFLNSYENREKITLKLIRQLEKIAIDYEFKNMIVTFESKESLLIEIFEKLEYKFIDELIMKKEFNFIN